MDIPLVICYPTEKALDILKERGFNHVQVVKIKAPVSLGEYFSEERVICQREKNGKIQLIVC